MDQRSGLMLLEHDGHGVMCDLRLVLAPEEPSIPPLKSTVEVIGDLEPIRVRVAFAGFLRTQPPDQAQLLAPDVEYAMPTLESSLILRVLRVIRADGLDLELWKRGIAAQRFEL